MEVWKHRLPQRRHVFEEADIHFSEGRFFYADVGDNNLTAIATPREQQMRCLLSEKRDREIGGEG